MCATMAEIRHCLAGLPVLAVTAPGQRGAAPHHRFWGNESMNETERRQLADRLSGMSFKNAHREMRRIDRDAVLKYFRNSIWDEYHTLWLLPNEGVEITLVEKADVDTLDKRDYSGPPSRRKLGVKYEYAEARVEPLERPVAKF